MTSVFVKCPECVDGCSYECGLAHVCGDELRWSALEPSRALNAAVLSAAYMDEFPGSAEALEARLSDALKMLESCRL